jgi:hypothetical protein
MVKAVAQRMMIAKRDGDKLGKALPYQGTWQKRRKRWKDRLVVDIRWQRDKACLRALLGMY